MAMCRKSVGILVFIFIVVSVGIIGGVSIKSSEPSRDIVATSVTKQQAVPKNTRSDHEKLVKYVHGQKTVK